MGQLLDADGNVVVRVAVVSGSTGENGSPTDVSALSREATQGLVKTAVENLDADIGAKNDAAATTDTGAFSVVSLIKRGLQQKSTANTAFGAPADARAAWYDSAASVIQLLKLSVAAFVGAGSRTYIYTAGVLTSEEWTLFGTKRTKTYTYTGGVLTGESDWV